MTQAPPVHPGWALGCGVEGLGCGGCQGSGFSLQSSGFRDQGSGFRVQGSWFMVQCAWCMVQGSGSIIQDLGFNVYGLLLFVLIVILDDVFDEGTPYCLLGHQFRYNKNKADHTHETYGRGARNL